MEDAWGAQGGVLWKAGRQGGDRSRPAPRVLSPAGQAADLQPARGPSSAAKNDGATVRVERRRRRWIRTRRRPGLRSPSMKENFPPAPAGEGQGGGYYNYPVVRRPVWTWEVPTYFWLGGMAAGAYVTASLAQNFGSVDDRPVAAGGYSVAAAALVPCAPPLIADLCRPERFHHLLRLFKPPAPLNPC